MIGFQYLFTLESHELHQRVQFFSRVGVHASIGCPSSQHHPGAPFRNPEKPQKLPVKTATLDKAVIDRIAQYYIRNGLEFEEKEVRRIYSSHSFRVLATNLLLECGRGTSVLDGYWVC